MVYQIIVDRKPHYGVDVIASSPGLSEQDIMFFKLNTLPKVYPAHRNLRPDVWNKGLGKGLFRVIRYNEYWAIIHVRYMGVDEVGRPNRYNAHVLLLTDDEFSIIGYNPFKLFPFFESPTAHPSDGSIPSIDLNQYRDVDVPTDFGLLRGRTKVIDMVLNLDGRRVYIILPGDSHMDLFVTALYELLPRCIRRSIRVYTLASDPEKAVYSNLILVPKSISGYAFMGQGDKIMYSSLTVGETEFSRLLEELLGDPDELSTFIAWLRDLDDRNMISGADDLQELARYYRRRLIFIRESPRLPTEERFATLFELLDISRRFGIDADFWYGKFVEVIQSSTEVPSIYIDRILENIIARKDYSLVDTVIRKISEDANRYELIRRLLQLTKNFDMCLRLLKYISDKYYRKRVLLDVAPYAPRKVLSHAVQSGYGDVYIKVLLETTDKSIITTNIWLRGIAYLLKDPQIVTEDDAKRYIGILKTLKFDEDHLYRLCIDTKFVSLLDKYSSIDLLLEKILSTSTSLVGRIIKAHDTLPDPVKEHLDMLAHSFIRRVTDIGSVLRDRSLVQLLGRYAGWDELRSRILGDAEAMAFVLKNYDAFSTYFDESDLKQFLRSYVEKTGDGSIFLRDERFLRTLQEDKALLGVFTRNIPMLDKEASNNLLRVFPDIVKDILHREPLKLHYDIIFDSLEEGDNKYVLSFIRKIFSLLDSKTYGRVFVIVRYIIAILLPGRHVGAEDILRELVDRLKSIFKEHRLTRALVELVLIEDMYGVEVLRDVVGLIRKDINLLESLLDKLIRSGHHYEAYRIIMCMLRDEVRDETWIVLRRLLSRLRDKKIYPVGSVIIRKLMARGRLDEAYRYLASIHETSTDYFSLYLDRRFRDRVDQKMFTKLDKIVLSKAEVGGEE